MTTDRGMSDADTSAADEPRRVRRRGMRTLVCAVALGVLAGPTYADGPGPDAPPNTAPDADAAADGPITLFDGASLAAWASTGANERGWQLQDGALAGAAGGVLESTRRFAGVDVAVEWRIDLGSQLVVGVGGGPMVSLWARAQGSGGLWTDAESDASPLAKGDRPPGEWNELRLRVVGTRVDAWVNGVPTVIDGRAAAREPGPIVLRAVRGPLWVRRVAVTPVDGPGPSTLTLGPGARVALVHLGEPEAAGWTRVVETYLRTSGPQPDIEVLALADALVGGGNAAGGPIPPRVARALAAWKPTVLAVMPMDAGGEPAVDAAWWRAWIDTASAVGATAMLVSPPELDPDGDARPAEQLAVLNARRRAVAAAARAEADRAGAAFGAAGEWHAAAHALFQPALGRAYPLSDERGRPREAASAAMAMGVLLALGVDGRVGTITIDMLGEAGSASPGHTVEAVRTREATIVSTRLPMTLWGDLRSPDGPYSLSRLLPINDRLSRLTLVAGGVPARARLWWGSEMRVVTSERLAAGVELTTLFDRYPTDERYFEIEAAVDRGQRALAALAWDDAAADLERVRAIAAEVREKVNPVRHTIRVEPLE